MDLYIKGNSKMIYSMARVNIYLAMVIIMKAISKMEREMVKENKFLINLLMKEVFQTIYTMDMEH